MLICKLESDYSISGSNQQKITTGKYNNKRKSFYSRSRTHENQSFSLHRAWSLFIYCNM